MNRSWDVFRTVTDFVRFSDTKAAVVLAFAGGSAAFLSSKIEVFHQVIVARGLDFFSVFLYLVVCCYIAGLVTTVVRAFQSIWPSMDSGDGLSLIYFKHICENFRGDHKSYAKALAAANMEEELAHQICINASIATRKYGLLSKAIFALVWAGATWVATLFLLFILGGAAPTP